MKKNFLLLFLMALLPLAGWAQTAEFGDVSLGKYAYGDATFPAPLVRDQKGSILNATEHYTIVGGAFTDEACTQAITTDVQKAAMKTDGTKYYRKIEGKVGSAFEGQSKVAYFTVDKCEITLTFATGSLNRTYGQDATAVTKAMLSPAPTFKFSQTWDGVVTGDAPTYTTVDINAGVKAVTFVPSASTWKAENYTFKYPEDFTLTIAQKSITPAVTLGSEVLTYNGEDQAPTITIKDGATVLPKDQFDITFSKTEGGTYGEDHATAGTWYVRVSGKATGNYSGTISDQGPFTIAKKDLNVYVDDLEKEYTGSEVVITDAKVLYSGLVGTDASTKNPFGEDAYTVMFAAAVPHINVGSYNLKPLAGTLGGNYANYNISLKESGKVTVKPKAITIKPANDLEKEFGKDDAFTSADIDASAALTSADRTNIQGSYTIVRSDASDNTVGTHARVLSLTKKAENVLTVVQKTTLANYTITTGTNDFKITSAKLYVYPKSVTITYGAETPELKVATSEDVTLTKTPTVKFKDGAAPTNVGTYVLTLVGEAAADGYEVELMDGQYTIEPKALTPVIATQTIEKNATVDALDQTKVTFEGLVGEDIIGYNLKFATGVDVTTDNTNAAGIAIEAKTVTGMKNTNYNIAWTATGKLIVGEGSSADIAFTSENTDADKIADQAGETQDVTINFTPRNGRNYGSGAATNWKAKKWTTMVLPFDISVADLSKALGYAIVNVIDADRTVVSGTGSKFYGKLTMTGGNGDDKVLKANKPFLVKIASDMNPATAYNFGHRTIVKADDTSVNAGGGCKFVGTYVNKPVSKNDEAAIWFMNGDEEGWQFIGATSDATWTIRPFEAYIDMSNVPAASRNITFYAEEIDGTVTAIKGISVDENGRAKLNAEGWYNLNGMKLQGAPIQKGIYIYNGKKYVVK